MVDLVLVNGLPGAGKTTVAHALATALAAPLIAKDALKEAVADAVPAVSGPVLGAAASDLMWTLAAAMSGLVVLESWWFRPRDLGFVEAGLRRCRPASVVEVWCDVPGHLARSRYAARRRHPVHDDAGMSDETWRCWEPGAEPLGVGPVVRIDTTGVVPLDELVKELGGGH